MPTEYIETAADVLEDCRMSVVDTTTFYLDVVLEDSRKTAISRRPVDALLDEGLVIVKSKPAEQLSDSAPFDHRLWVKPITHDTGTTVKEGKKTFDHDDLDEMNLDKLPNGATATNVTVEYEKEQTETTYEIETDHTT